VIGRLGATEFAVLAPGTDAEGARRLAERLASSVSAATITPAGAPPAVRMRCGYEAVANVGYAPIEPVDLLVRAAAAVRTGKVDSATWLRRFDEAATPPASPASTGTRQRPAPLACTTASSAPATGRPHPCRKSVQAVRSWDAPWCEPGPRARWPGQGVRAHLVRKNAWRRGVATVWPEACVGGGNRFPGRLRCPCR